MKIGFVPVKIEEYIESHMKNNPTELRKNLWIALKDYEDGQKCNCGNAIWVIGSAIAGNASFTCITGEAFPDQDFEIADACM